MNTSPPASRARDVAGPHSQGLARTLTLPLVVLYGLGVTIGAGIYVLVGAAAGIADTFIVPQWVPVAGFVSCMVFLVVGLL